VLAARSLEALARDLNTAIEAMGIEHGDFGKPEMVEKSAAEAERLFQGYTKAKPRKEDAYAAARAFLGGYKLDGWQQDLVASAIAEPIKEHSGSIVLGSKLFPALLANYEKEARSGDLWRLTWHGLLYSYFGFDPSASKDTASHEGWEALRAFLERTWPLVDRQAGNALVPDWVEILRKESNILSGKPVDKYARAYLQGDTATVDRLSNDLGIPPSSWFWHALVLGAVNLAAAYGDSEFRRLVPRLLLLIGGKPGFRDEALEIILVRYHACKSAPQDEQLRDFVCQASVWKNPKLKSAGIATAWNRVPEPVWRMVLSWVNERNLKDFFDILAARNRADDRRLAFWSNYLGQITWTRLVFGADTLALQRSNTAIRDLIAREQGAYAILTGKREVDAFMMQVGSYLIIEFSRKPNACYVYKVDELPFEPYARQYTGRSEDLAARLHPSCVARIVHLPGWEDRAAEDLRRLGIRPDQPVQQAPVGRSAVDASSRTTERPASTGAASTSRPSSEGYPDMTALHTLMSRFRGASIDDRRSTSGGRLWVTDPLNRTQLEAELKALGFEWAPSRSAWYHRGGR
jgi:hypothetical protein